MGEGAGDPLEAKPSAVAVLFVPSSPDVWVLPIRSLLDRTDLPVVVGCLYPQFVRDFEALGPRVRARQCGSVSQLVNETWREHRAHVVVVDDAVVLPPDPFVHALRWLDDDVRVASVSFLSNAADFLSFPVRNLPQDRPIDGHDEVSITRRLRAEHPPAEPAPVAHATGAVVVLGSAALGAVGELEAPASARFDVAVADFSARARSKGFVDLCDTGTFVTRPSDAAMHPIADTLTPDDRGWLLHRHRSLIGYLEHERMSGDSPFALAHQVARVKVAGLRVLVDGSCFGPNEVGTQVATAHTIRALAASPAVREVCVALPGPVPAYAASVLTAPKVRAMPASSADLSVFGPVDIAFRPYQPVPGWDVGAWKHAGVRLVVSVLDTIAFHNGGYFADSGAWMAYRDSLRASVRAADAITVISDDVAAQLRLHALPIDGSLVTTVPLGTEHLRGDDPTRLPAELAARGFGAGSFALCLGVNYTHKNRELALLAHAELCRRGFDLSLVLAGAAVPHGTSRVAEARVGTDDRVFVLPELAQEERNWLLRHASLVWYPTSAEGFGLVPFEAAAFGTPTVSVDFGPLRELADGRTVDPGAGGRPSPLAFGDDVPVLAADWTPEALADAAVALLTDPDRARRHREAVAAAGARYSWDRTAATLVRLFREALARPAR